MGIKLQFEYEEQILRLLDEIELLRSAGDAVIKAAQHACNEVYTVPIEALAVLENALYNSQSTSIE